MAARALASRSESFWRLNPHLTGPTATASVAVWPPVPLPTEVKPKKLRIRQSEKPLLNKLESEWLELLKAHDPATGWKGGHSGFAFNIRSQAKRYRLGNGIWYKPDFTATVDLRETAWEVKGPHAFRGGFENLKVAAGLYPEVKWVLCWKDGGQWMTQIVLP